MGLRCTMTGMPHGRWGKGRTGARSLRMRFDGSSAPPDAASLQKARPLRSASIAILAATAALTWAACGETGDDGARDPITLHAREVPAGVDQQRDLPAALRDDAGPVQETVERSPGTSLGRLVRIRDVRSDGDRIVLTMEIADRAQSAQPAPDGADEVADEPTTPPPPPSPTPAAEDGGAPADHARSPASLELPTSPDVTVVGGGRADVGAAAVEEAVELAADDAPEQMWQVTVRHGEVIELLAEPPGGD